MTESVLQQNRMAIMATLMFKFRKHRTMSRPLKKVSCSSQRLNFTVPRVYSMERILFQLHNSNRREIVSRPLLTCASSVIK